MHTPTDENAARYMFEPKITKENLHEMIDASALEVFAIDVDLQRMIILVSIPAK